MRRKKTAKEEIIPVRQQELNHFLVVNWLGIFHSPLFLKSLSLCKQEHSLISTTISLLLVYIKKIKRNILRKTSVPGVTHI